MSRSPPPACSFSEEFFSSERASFPPPLALLGYVPLPTSCSYEPQTPNRRGLLKTFLNRIRFPYLRCSTCATIGRDAVLQETPDCFSWLEYPKALSPTR